MVAAKQFARNLLTAYSIASLLSLMGALALFKNQWDIAIDGAKNLAAKDIKISSVVTESILTDGLTLLDIANRDLNQLIEDGSYRSPNIEIAVLKAMSLFAKSNQMESYGLLLVTDSDGRLIARSDGLRAEEINLNDRYYYLDLKRNPDKTYTVGPMVKARTTGEPIFHLAARVDSLDGDFMGALILQVNAEAVSKSVGFAIDARNLSITAILPNNEVSFSTLANGFNPSSESGTSVMELIDLSNHNDSILFSDRRDLLVVQSDTYGFGLRYLSSQSMDAIWADFLKENEKLFWLVLLSYVIFSYLMWIIYRQYLATERDRMLSTTDPLTALPNRRAFDSQYEQFLKDAERSQASISVLFIDIDRFKECNDTYGHANGDLVIKGLVAIIKSELRRPLDSCYRWGGEELVVLLPGTDTDGAKTVAENILRTVRESRFELRGFEPIHVTVSIGIACADHLMQGTENNLVDRADQAMYRAKQGGRDRYSM